MHNLQINKKKTGVIKILMMPIRWERREKGRDQIGRIHPRISVIIFNLNGPGF